MKWNEVLSLTVSEYLALRKVWESHRDLFSSQMLRPIAQRLGITLPSQTPNGGEKKSMGWQAQKAMLEQAFAAYKIPVVKQ